MDRNDDETKKRLSPNRSPSKYRSVALGAGITALCVILLTVAAHFGIEKLFDRKADDSVATSAILVDMKSTLTPTIFDEESVHTAKDTPTISTVLLSPTPDASEIAASQATVRAAELSLLEQEITDFLDTQTARYSMYYINLSNGETIAYKERETMVAASTIKLPINTYLYQLVAAGEVSLDEVRKYDSRAYPSGDRHGGFGIIQDAADGTEYTI